LASQAPRGVGIPGVWPYAAPYLAFGLVVSLRGEGGSPAWALAQVLVPGALIVLWAWRGAYPELAGWRPRPGPLLADVGVGLAIAALWLGPFLAFEALPRPGPEAAFDPGLLGDDPAARGATLALRLAGFALVTPFMEELFVRSFLLRFLDVFDRDEDFRDVPIGRFAWRSFVGTVLWFTVTHQTWEWVVALPTGIVFNLWLYRRKRLGAVVVSHAVANAAIFAFVLTRAGADPGLWIFL